MKQRRICVLGLGYVGLPTASLLGTKGYDVLGVDTDPEIVERISKGEIHIAEPGLDILVKSAIQSGNLRADMQPAAADVFIIAVPTPFLEDRTPDLTFVEAATRSITPHLQAGNLVILESTCPVGTTGGTVAATLRDAGFTIGKDVFVAHCPERVLPGKVLTELVELDRVVGGVDEASTKAAAEFFAEFVSGAIFKTDAATAEMSKLAENAYRDVNIALANEFSVLCDHEGINPWHMISLANQHPRVNILQPGPGVGGHCIAVDPWFLISRNPKQAQLLRAARLVNDGKPGWVVEKVKAKAEKFLNPVIACLGLAFKADVGDLRQSPAVQIVRELINQKVGDLLICEPNLAKHAEFHLVKLDEAVNKADIILVLVDHKEFRKLRAADLKEKVVIDTRGIIG